MKRILLLGLLGGLFLNTSAQSDSVLYRKNRPAITASQTLGVIGCFSVNYETKNLFPKKQEVVFMWSAGVQISGLVLPVSYAGINTSGILLLGNRNHYFESELGAFALGMTDLSPIDDLNLWLPSDDEGGEPGPLFLVVPKFRLGYRYQSRTGHSFFKTGLSITGLALYLGYGYRF